MRPKFVLSLLLLTLLVITAAVLLKQHLAPVKLEAEAAAPPAVATAPAPAPAPAAPRPAPVVVKTVTPEEREAAIQAEENKLDTWSMNDDPQSLSQILNDLTSPEQEVRLAAIEATKQFGSTNAIPALKSAAANSDDTQEQIAMLEAADFISLPDVIFGPKGDSQTPKTPAQIQALAQSQAKAAARRQAYFDKHHPNQNSQSTGPATSETTPTTSANSAPNN